RGFLAEVRGCDDGEQTRLTEPSVHAVAAGGGDADRGPEITEADLRAGLPNTGDAEHAGAVRRRADRAAFVAGGGDDQHAACGELEHDIAIRGTARPATAETQIDDLCRI